MLHQLVSWFAVYEVSDSALWVLVTITGIGGALYVGPLIHRLQVRYGGENWWEKPLVRVVIAGWLHERTQARAAAYRQKLLREYAPRVAAMKTFGAR